MKKITQSLMALSVVVPSAALIQSADQVQAQVQKEVTSQSLNVRSGPSDNSRIVDWLQKGQTVNVLRETNNWDYIQFANGKTGYVYDQYLKTISSSDENRSVTAYWLTLRNGPSAHNSPIDYLKKGTVVKVVSNTGNWAKVSVNGKTGYVDSAYLSEETTNNSSSVTSSPTRKVTAYWLTLRNGPSTKYKDIGYLKQNTVVSVHSTKDGWSYVTANGKSGYVNDKYLSKVSSSTSSTPTPSTPDSKPTVTTSVIKYINVPDGLNLRSGRGVTNQVIVKIPYEASVKVSDISNGWGKVQYGNYTGYVNVSYLTDTKPATTTPTHTSGSLKGKTIVLDPGHGGQFPGAQGYVAEEDINLQIALKTRDQLQAKGATVYMTRTSDVACSNAGYVQDLTCRPALATKMHASAFISIHANSGSASANGSESFWYNSNRGDKQLATLILNNIVSETGMNKRPVDFGNFSVIRNSEVPATLIETGFVTNKSDAAKLGSAQYQLKFADAIAKGVEQFFQ